MKTTLSSSRTHSRISAVQYASTILCIGHLCWLFRLNAIAILNWLDVIFCFSRREEHGAGELSVVYATTSSPPTRWTGSHVLPPRQNRITFLLNL